MKSLLKQPDYSQDWVKDFYTQAGIWWGNDPQAAGTHEERVRLVERLCGPGPSASWIWAVARAAPWLLWQMLDIAWLGWN